MLPLFRRGCSVAGDKVVQQQQLQQLIAEPHMPSTGASARAGSGDRDREKRSILRSLFQSTDDMVTVPNNASVDIPPSDGKRVVRVHAQSLDGGEDQSLSESTNSSYCRISELISYNWEPQQQVNLLAVHRCKPLVAYVINTSYHKAAAASGSASGKQPQPQPQPRSAPDDQMIRLVNYDNQSRALCKPGSDAAIADIAFSFDSPKRPESNLIVCIDRTAAVSLFSFKCFFFNESAPQLSLSRLLTVQSSVTGLPVPAERFRLSWCLYVPGDAEEEEPPVDPSLRLVVTTGTAMEVFTFNDYHFQTPEQQVDRSYFKSNLGEYYVALNVHSQDIVSAGLSNDGSLTCTASLANVLKFYQIDDSLAQMRYLREWQPPLPDGHVIAYSCFLDDIDYLLTHPDQLFWGYLFVATNKGHMYIFNLQEQEWSVVQQLSLVCDETSGAAADDSFSYVVDKSAKVLLAVRRRSVFVFLLEFSEDAVRVPRIKQVARLQLYNDVISMQVKQSLPHQIEVFWITLKNLERCTIDVAKLNESKMKSKPIREAASVDGASSLAKVLLKDRKPPVAVRGLPATSPKEQDLLNKLQEKSEELDILKKKLDPAALAGRARGLSPSAPATPKAALLPVTPTSTAAAVNPMDSLLGKLVNGQKQVVKSPQVSTFPVSPAVTSGLNDMAKVMLIEEKLKTFEARFTKQLDSLSGAVAAGFQAVHSELSQLKSDLHQPSKQTVDRSLVEATINTVVEKSMKQMNVLISKGLKEFFDQADVGIGELQANVGRATSDLKTAFDETRGQVSSFKAEVDLIMKQMERLDAQQQLLLFRYSQLVDQA